MATSKKRIAISLPPELEQALNELREATGAAPASFVVEVMTRSIPMIRAVTQAALEAKQNPNQALLLMQRSLMSATSEALDLQRSLVEEGISLRRSTLAPASSNQAVQQVADAKEGSIEKPKRKRAVKSQRPAA